MTRIAHNFPSTEVNFNNEFRRAFLCEVCPLDKYLLPLERPFLRGRAEEQDCRNPRGRKDPCLTWRFLSNWQRRDRLGLYSFQYFLCPFSFSSFLLLFGTLLLKYVFLSAFQRRCSSWLHIHFQPLLMLPFLLSLFLLLMMIFLVFFFSPSFRCCFFWENDCFLPRVSCWKVEVVDATFVPLFATSFNFWRLGALLSLSVSTAYSNDDSLGCGDEFSLGNALDKWPVAPQFSSGVSTMT